MNREVHNVKLIKILEISSSGLQVVAFGSSCLSAYCMSFCCLNLKINFAVRAGKRNILVDMKRGGRQTRSQNGRIFS